MADISKIKLPSGTEYDIKDAVAREIAGGGIKFRGITSTAITDLSTTTTYQIVGEQDTRTAVSGDFVIYDKKEFVFAGSDSKWHELGDNSAFKALAYKDNASATYTPAGTVSQPTFSGSELTSTGSFTPEGSVAAPVISTDNGSTTTIKNPTKATVAKTVVAAAPGETAPSNSITYYAVANETLSLYQIGYTTGDSITTSDVSVLKGDASFSATAPAFTGTQGSVSVAGTPAGTVSTPSFTGTEATITVS